jgi:hypothetical protein
MRAWVWLLTALGCSPTTYVHGIPNLAQVESGVWRSGQPRTVEQWRYLRSLGISRVVKLNFPSEGSDDGARAAGMTVLTVSIQPEGDLDIWDNLAATFIQPSGLLLTAAVQALEQGNGVLVHCTHGQDRTGLVVGRYRVIHNHWSSIAAYEEMIRYHFHPALHGLHESWESFAKAAENSRPSAVSAQ